MRVLVIIPAKLDSKRLKNKNIREIGGIPMFLHSVDYANASKYNVDVIVSSESDIVEEICNQNDVDSTKDLLIYVVMLR
jgi:CMP-N-acetylneuraminic acid synthetase